MFGNIGRAEKYLWDSRAVYPLVWAGLITVWIFVIFAGSGGPGDPTSIDTWFGQ